MVIGLLTAKLSIPHAQSLKDKRQVIRSLKDRVVNKMNVSVAEVDFQDVWKSAELAFVTVSAEKQIAESRLSDISKMLHASPGFVLLDIHTEWL